MKKLALTLAALATVSAVASAKEVVAAPVVAVEQICPAPVVQEGQLITEYIEQGLSDTENSDHEVAIYRRSKNAYKGFRATSFGMEAEWEHENHNFNALAVVASVGMAYGDDWNFGLAGVAFYDLPRQSDNYTGTGANSSNARLELSVRKNNKFENGARLDIGARYRGQATQDRWAVRLNNYSYPLGFTTLSGWGLIEYRETNGNNNNQMRYEVMPLNFTVGPFKIGPYYYGGRGVASSNEYLENRFQVRAYSPLYSEGKFSSNLEFRYEWKREIKNADGVQQYGFDQKTKIGNYGGYINVGYDLTPQLNVYSYLGVFANNWEFSDAQKAAGKAYGTTWYTDFGVGFGYAF